MGGIDWTALPLAVAMYGVQDVEALIERLMIIKTHKPQRGAETKRLISLAMAPSDVIFQAVRDKRTDIEFSKQYENIISDVYEYAQTAETQQMNSTRGTLFGAYNAITGYYQNVKDWKSADAKMGSLLDGTASERSRKAFDLCMNAGLYIN